MHLSSTKRKVNLERQVKEDARLKKPKVPRETPRYATKQQPHMHHAFIETSTKKPGACTNVIFLARASKVSLKPTVASEIISIARSLVDVLWKTNLSDRYSWRKKERKKGRKTCSQSRLIASKEALLLFTFSKGMDDGVVVSLASNCLLIQQPSRPILMDYVGNYSHVD